MSIKGRGIRLFNKQYRKNDATLSLVVMFKSNFEIKYLLLNLKRGIFSRVC